MANRGRKAVITAENYLKAVKDTNSLNDETIGQRLGVNRSTVNRFKNSPEMIEFGLEAKANEIIAMRESIRFDSQMITREFFDQLPVIVKWREIQERRRVKPKVIKTRISTLWRVCRYLKTHPENLNIDTLSTLTVKHRDLMLAGKEPPYGLSYYSMRTSIRSYFQLIRGISGELLSSKGIDAGRSEGTGKQAQQKVTSVQRISYEKALRSSVISAYNKNSKFAPIDPELYYRELLTFTQFMYYTGSRVSASQAMTCNDPLNKYGAEIWELHITDKGRGSRIEWQKILTGDALNKMRDYVKARFGLEKDQQDDRLGSINLPIFPELYDAYGDNVHYREFRPLIKRALHQVGNKTTIPNHIWRHTFAQDFLHASDWNYELCASVGGWKDTGTLKLSYGEMSEDARQRGLKKAMGLPVEDVTYALSWDGSMTKRVASNA